MLLKQLLITILIAVLALTTALILYPKPSPKSASATETEDQTNTTEDVGQPKVHNVRYETKSNTSSESSDAYYQFIIDNNIFRSLGWQPSKKQPDYTLIGTAFSQNAADSNAYILERGSNQMHIVKLGERLGDARVKEIQSKRVILHEAGKDIILYCGRLQFY